MDRKINPALCQGFLNFLREHSLGADFGERYVGNLVASGVNDFDFDIVSLATQE